MSEELNEQIVEETTSEATQESVETVQEELEQVEKDIDEVSAESKTTEKPSKEPEREENLRALRKSRERLKSERDEYLARLKSLELAQQQATNKKDEGLDFNYEDYDPTKKEIAELKKQYQELAVSSSRMKLYSKCPDFNKVVTEESIAILREQHPELAATLDAGKDFYATGVSTYNIIKKFGLHLEDDSIDNQRRLAENSTKPKAVNSVASSSPLSRAKEYSDISTKEGKAAIIKRAMELARNA